MCMTKLISEMTTNFYEKEQNCKAQSLLLECLLDLLLVDRLVEDASDAAIEQLLLSFLVFPVRWYQNKVRFVTDLTLRKVGLDLRNFLLKDGVVYSYVEKDESVAFLAIALLVELLELIEYVAHGEDEVCAVAQLHLFAQGEFQGESINHIVSDDQELA